MYEYDYKKLYFAYKADVRLSKHNKIVGNISYSQYHDILCYISICTK